jgi:hypothetical protein
MPSGKRAAPKNILGKTGPRLWTPPLRPLNRRTSLGYECCDFMANVAGEPFDPWQEWVVKHALELNPDGTFRFRIILIHVARQSGKSALKRGVSLWRMYMHPRSRLLGVAQEVTLAREQWQMAQDTIHACPDLENEWGNVRNTNGDEYFWLQNGSRYKIGAANRRSGRGGTNDEVGIDELREQRNWDAWAALSKTTMAKDNSQIWCMSNAGDDESVVLNQLLDVARAGTDPTIFLADYSAPDGCELDDWNAIRQANPNLGRRVSVQAIQTAMSTDPPNVFRTEVMCQRVDMLDGAIDTQRWDGCADAMGSLDPHRRHIAACFDVAPDGQHATLAVAARLEDGRARVEIAAAWPTTDAARAELPALLDRIRPVAFGWYPGGPAAGIATTIRPLAMKYNKRPGGKRQPGDPPEDGAIAGSHVTEACQELADLTKALRVVHPADPLLDAHIRAASKLISGDGWRFTRKGGGGHVDAAYAAAGAVKLALTMPAPRRARVRMIA